MAQADIIDVSATTSSTYYSGGSSMIIVEVEFESTTGEAADLIEFVLSGSPSGVTVMHGSMSPSPYSGCGSNTGDQLTGFGPGWGTPGASTGNSQCGAFAAGVTHVFGLAVTGDGTYEGPLDFDVRVVGDGVGGTSASITVASLSVAAVTCALICPDVAPVSADADACEADVTIQLPTLEGDCVGNVADQSGIYPVGVNEVVFSAQDDLGNTVTCTSIVMVMDNQAPVLEGCTNVEVEITEGECGSIFTLPFTAMSDNCGDMAASLSQSTDDSSVDQGFDCPAGNTSYWRVYDLSAYDINTSLEVSGVTIRAFQSVNNPEVTVNLYSLTGNITTGTVELVGTGSMNIGNLDDAMVTIPVEASFDATDQVAVEVVVPGSMFAGPVMGLNDQGEDAPTFITSAFCGIDTPTTLSALGFAGFGAVINIEGVELSTALVQLDNSGFEPGDTLPAGTYNFAFQLIDASGNTSNTCSFTYDVLAFDGAISAIACNDNIQISLDEDCMAVVTADQILEGGPYGCFDDYTVELFGANNINYGNTVTSVNEGMTLQVQVTGPNFNACWGTVTVEDKAPAELECRPIYTTCQGDLEPGASISPVVTFEADLNPITENLPASGTVARNINIPVFGLNDATLTNIAVQFDIAHEAVSDLTAMITSPDGVSRVLFMQPGTDCTEDNLQIMINPNASNTAQDLMDTCAVGADFAITGAYQPAGDLSVYNGTNPEGQWTITLSDVNDGNGGTVTSVRLILSQTGGEVEFPTTKDIAWIPTSDGAYRVTGLDGCGPTILGYVDIPVPQSCDSPYDQVIERTWSATDESGNESEPCTQTIYVFRSGLEAVIFPPNYDDLDLPSLSCSLYADQVPGTNVTGGVTGELCDIIQVFEPEDTRLDICEGSYKILRKFKVLQWCSGEVLEHTQIIKVLDKEGPVLEDLEDVTVSADEFDCEATVSIPRPEVLSDCSDEFTYKLEYLQATNDGPAPVDAVYISENVMQGGGEFFITSLNFGNTWIKWTVQDECGNTSVEFYTLTVEDDISPIAVCDEFTVVSVGGDGRILVDAISFDDGSFDNCGVRSYDARKMTDVCNSGSTSFRSQVEFCCAEIGNGPIMVEFRVTDNYGNANTCMVEVEVQDKLPPYITFCPDDIVLNCQADYTDLSVTGEAEGVDNCEVASLLYEDSGAIDNCGEGVITRTWTITDITGLKNSCTQSIILENEDPFDRDDIDWPDDLLTTTCESDLNPENLPAINAYPRYDEGTCSLVATTYKDQRFSFVDGACEKILRTWTVIDWCEYDEINPVEDEGIYHYVQLIKLTNTEAPVVENCVNVTLESYGACEGEVTYTLTAIDDCTATEELVYSYEIDAFGDGIADPALDGNGPTIDRVLPDGSHIVRWSVEDKCGNTTICEMELRVADAKKPTPYCRGTIVTAVMNSNGMIDIWASDYDLGSFDNCTPQEDLLFSFSSTTTDTRRVFSCDDLPDGDEAIIPLQMWVTDANGNQDFCDITIRVQDNEANFCEPDTSGSLTISGTIETLSSKPVSGVQVTVAAVGETVQMALTDADGAYSAAGLAKGYDYDITASKNDDVKNGINTLDLIKIQRHILGIEEFVTGHQYVAADVNNDQRVRASDLLALRKVILGVSTEFPNGQESWRFLPAGYEFGDLQQTFPFVENIFNASVQYSAPYQNMTAVKIGDMNNSVNTLQNQKPTESRSDNALRLLVDDVNLEAATVVEVPVYATAQELAGYQFTLEMEGVSFVEVIGGQLDMSAQHVGIFGDAITTSWNTTESKTVYIDAPLFTLVFEVNEALKALDALTLTSSITEAVAFDLAGNTMDVELLARSATEELDEFKLFQNRPNPFTASSKIAFYIPSPDDVRLNIYDVTGRLIFTKSQYFVEGMNEFNIENDNLEVGGILYYEVSAGESRATMKMISIK